MKKIIFISLILISIHISAYSQTKQESIRELFHLMQVDSTIDKMFTNLIPSIMKEMQAESKDSAEKAKSDKIMRELSDIIREISKRMINDDMVQFYDKYYTQEDINAYIAFYKTPAGQKMVQMTPAMQKDMSDLYIKKYLPELEKKIDAIMDSKK
jgi:hypothetical protein